MTLASSIIPHDTPQGSIHKTNSHTSTNCQALQNMHINKNIFTTIKQLGFPPPTIVSLENPIEEIPFLILMTTNESRTCVSPLLHVLLDQT